MMQSNKLIYLISIFSALVIVEFFFFLQVTFVLKEFKPQYIIVPTLLGISIGFLIGKIQVLRRKLTIQKKLFHTIANEAREFSYFKNVSGQYEYVSPASKDLTGYSQEEFYADPELLEKIIDKDDSEAWAKHLEEVHGLHETHENIEFRIVTKQGEKVWVNHNCSPVYEDGIKVGIRSVNTNITKRKNDEKSIQALSLYDTLTGLPNRKYIFQKLEELQNKESEFSIVFLDLNRFKKVNDSLGHSVGDEVLRKVAKNFSACVEKNTFVGRLGGDEFIVIFENLTSKIALDPYLQKLHSLISGEYSVGEYTFYIGNSIGVAYYPQDSQGLQDLLVCADKAMYKAKSVSSSDIVFYSDLIRDYKFDDLLLEKELRKALESKEIMVYLQPKFDTQSNAIMGYEALSRWKKDDRFISPAVFIPLAEETGLIKDITMYVMEEVFIIAKKWHSENRVNKISINISMIDFMSDKIVEKIKEKILYHDVDATWFELEVTESVFLENSEKISQKIQQLIDLGFSVALDDFGTGYSSLAYLTKLPINTLKIDKTFIDNLNTDYEKTFLLLKSILTIAKDLKFDIVIEGVETQEQLDILNVLGAYVIQGFYFYKPMTFESIEKIET